MTQELPFDAVIMLTWSNWNTEPRSNRYHYATRFARHCPVLFVQPWGQPGEPLRVEKTEVDGIDLVQGPRVYSRANLEQFRALLTTRGIRAPLLWIYDSLHYQPLIEALPNSLRVYHATEDYLQPSNGWNQDMSVTRDSVLKLLPHIDLIVAVSAGVLRSYQNCEAYSGPLVLAENGVDATYFLDACDMHGNKAGEKTAIFQGGINNRLDYELIDALVERMPDWTFDFCGAAQDHEVWSKILRRQNVRYHGAVPPDEFARRMRESSVGIIPYIQDRWIHNSLPLKAYEYVACGLPVVTVPIAFLEDSPDLFATVRTVEDFETAMRRVAKTRHDPALLGRRKAAALANSYDRRFEKVIAAIGAEWAARRSTPRREVAILYDSAISLHVSTIKEHLCSFEQHSRHNVSYVPATSPFWKRDRDDVSSMIDFSVFDTVIVHYSIRLSVREHLDAGVAQRLREYGGQKILFLQDEYEGVEIARQWMDFIGFDVVYTCVPLDSIEKIYPPYRYPSTRFLRTLTGYVSAGSRVESFATPLAERKRLIAYRGRQLPAIYGMLGYEKFRIGAEMKAVAEQRGLDVDIQVGDQQRIYGDDWYRFLGAARATLGTESGANIFDFNGSIQKAIDRYKKDNPDADFPEIWENVLKQHDDFIVMNQISPKIFEAIQLRTALVLFEGSYSGVVESDKHYIPLAKDFSNVDDVVAKLQDTDYLERLTERAYRDVILSGCHSYETFVHDVDEVVAEGTLARGAQKSLRALFSIGHDGKVREALPALPINISAGSHILGFPRSIDELADCAEFDKHESIDSVGATAPSVSRRTPVRALRWAWGKTPSPVRCALVASARKILQMARTPGSRSSIPISVARSVWRRLPIAMRDAIASRIDHRR